MFRPASDSDLNISSKQYKLTSVMLMATGKVSVLIETSSVPGSMHIPNPPA